MFASSAPETCDALSTITKRMPKNLLEHSNLDDTTQVPVGASIDLTCKANFQLSTDEDGYFPDDNKFK